MSVTVELMNESGMTPVPSQADFVSWSSAVVDCLNRQNKAYEVGIRLVSETESASLNQNFRQKQGPTNVLSFSYSDIHSQAESNLLGDLAICSPLVALEAREQNKTQDAHWAHMTVHGMLHLLGYDHQHEAEADSMENLEGVILNKLGYANPYQVKSD